MTAQPGPPDDGLFDVSELLDPKALAKARAQEAARPEARRPAGSLSVARVIVDTPLPHLDRYFDYRVSADQDAQAVAGCRVKVWFHGRLLSGLIAERVETSDFGGQLLYLDSVVSAEPVLSPEVLELARAVADRYAGTLNEVAKLAIPPRRIRVEREEPPEPPDPPEREDADTGPGPWAHYPDGPGFVAALREGRAARAVWNALPGPGWDDAIAVAAEAALDAGRGTVIVLPNSRDVRAVDAALTRRLGEGRHAALPADLGPTPRYRRWLSVLHGRTRVVVGSRLALLAPVRDLGLVVLWDDGDDVHVDQSAPYPHARTVLAMRAHMSGAGALFGGHTRSTDTQLLVESGWAQPLVADRATLRGRAPVIRPAGDDHELARDEAARTARLPSLALKAAREGAREGPVLFQVPRRGYLNALACAGCREPARCEACRGPLAIRDAHAVPSCGWCGRVAGRWTCSECGSPRMRAVVVGDRRTAEELGRAFPSLTVRTSGRDEVLAQVPNKPSLVVSTPGAEPVVPDGGYAAAVLLDGWALLNRPDLRASEEALRRWLNAAALVRPGGTVVVAADASVPVVQSLVRWDPAGFAERELAERRGLGFPPAVSMASITGAPEHVRELLDQIRLPESAEVLGPVPVDTRTGDDGGVTERALLRVPRGAVGELSRALKAAASARSARRDEHLVQVRVDPLQVL
ncbi:primosomal protein N' [Nocardiopsis sp. NPDC007018]|uniref:primosomal protein N' n=1 Tax=Nocardiopsis sp. NPDC007018 TaxID=3155721 RepID=UPI0033E36E65